MRRDQLLQVLLDRLGRDHQAGEPEVEPIAAPKLRDHRVVLVHVGRVLQAGVAELAAYDRAVFELVRIHQGGKPVGEAPAVDEDVLEGPLRLEVGDRADPRESAGRPVPSGARARYRPR